MRVYPEADAARWNELITRLPYHHILQSYQWGEFKSSYGWSAHRLVFERDMRPQAAAQVLQRRLPRLPWSIMYVPKGPALDYSDIELVDEVLSYLERFARQNRALLIKIDPDVALNNGNPEIRAVQAHVTAPSPPAAAAEEVLNLFTRRGWTFSREQIQYKNTVVLDLSQSEEKLLADMKPKTRYNIRLAARKGVEVESGGEGHLATFYQLYAETSARDGFLIRPFAYYEQVWRSFLQHDLASLLLARWQSSYLAGLMLFRLGNKAWYMYGASTSAHRNLMPNYLLQWEAIRLARRQGCLLYDLWGAPDRLDESDPMWGVYRFKEGLGGQLVQHIGAYDFPAHRFPFWIYTVALPVYLSFLRSRHRRTTPND